jgi:hypothetical protein
MSSTFRLKKYLNQCAMALVPARLGVDVPAGAHKLELHVAFISIKEVYIDRKLLLNISPGPPNA